MAPDVKCTVDNCKFWENNICTAESIEVAKNFLEGPDLEAGMIGKDSKYSSQTMCNTYQPKKQQ